MEATGRPEMCGRRWPGLSEMAAALPPSPAYPLNSSEGSRRSGILGGRVLERKIYSGPFFFFFSVCTESPTPLRPSVRPRAFVVVERIDVNDAARNNVGGQEFIIRFFFCFFSPPFVLDRVLYGAVSPSAE